VHSAVRWKKVRRGGFLWGGRRWRLAKRGWRVEAVSRVPPSLPPSLHPSTPLTPKPQPLEDIAKIITTPSHANCVDVGNGNYPLHIAAQNGHGDLVTWLVKNGAEVNVQVRRSSYPGLRTPLWVAPLSQ
jgi:ankyrin repeat protein